METPPFHQRHISKKTHIMKKLALLTSAALIITGIAPATAQDYENDIYEVPTEKQGTISLSIGYFDALGDDDSAIDLRAEYRYDRTYLGFLKPWAGVEVTSDASLWGGGGLLIDHEFTPNWYITPSLGAGLYTKGNSDIDLDFPVQFRTQLEIAHQYDNGHRAGIALSHISNVGIGDNNPGTEVLSLYWHNPY